MQDNARPSKAVSPRSKGPDTREDRLKSALKANMARRKAQARARAVGDETDAAPGAANNEKDE